MNIYRAMYRGKCIEVESDTSYHAQMEAARIFKAKKSYEVTVILLEKDGVSVVHLPLM